MDSKALSEMVNDAIRNLSFKDAIFYANKLVTTEPNNLSHVYLLGQAYFHSGQYHRCLTMIKNFLPRLTVTGSVEIPTAITTNEFTIVPYLQCLRIAALSHTKLNQWLECLSLIDTFFSAMQFLNIDVSQLYRKAEIANGSLKNSIRVTALIYLLKGQSFEHEDIRGGCVDWYLKALQEDARCSEAWRRITEGNLLTNTELHACLASLNIPEELEWLKATYLCDMNQVTMSFQNGAEALLDPNQNSHEMEISMDETHTPQDTKRSQKTSNLDLVKKLVTHYHLGNNEDVIAARAHSAFYTNQIQKAFELTSKVINNDPYSTNILIIHLSCMVELKKKNDLHLLAHRLTENSPSQPISWYAVGCYYYTINSWKNARSYFNKAAMMDRSFGPAWLAYGHTFNLAGEHDGALAAYRSAARLMVGSHLPSMYIAAELAIEKDYELAFQFAFKSISLLPNDPYALHELGVIYYRLKDWKKAVTTFKAVLNYVRGEKFVSTWEPTFYNLAQSYQKLGQYDNAETFYRLSLDALPFNPSSLTALGTVLHLRGDLDGAVEAYNAALAILPDDSFTNECLECALRTHAITCEFQPDVLI